MTDDQIRIAIAEWCGWKFIVSHDVMGKAVPDRWIKDEMEYFEDHPFPDYPNDLNAVHEMEKRLEEESFTNINCYVGRLADVCRPEGSDPDSIDDLLRCIHATARQRCEALLKTIGKWKE
jgi:hypothetical protein